MTTIQSRHYCTTCKQKTLFVAHKHGFLAMIFTFGLSSLINLLRGAGIPRCQTCGSRQSLIPFRGALKS